MDARITKQRLGNLLSYDWLKIVGIIIAAAALISVLFTMIRTRPKDYQEYQVFYYGDVVMTQEGSASLKDELEKRFSFDILEVTSEGFTEARMGSAAFVARRGVLEGSVFFLSDFSASEDEKSDFATMCTNGLAAPGTPSEAMGMFCELPAYFEELEGYLVRFFGEEWRTGTLDEAEARACFLARDSKDKRFKTAAQKETGVSLECERLNTLRENYLYVLEHGFEAGVGNADSTLSFTDFVSDGYDTAEGHVDCAYPVGIDLSKFNRITDLCYYLDADGHQAKQKLELLIFNNGSAFADMRYETVTLLRYLLETYDA